MLWPTVCANNMKFQDAIRAAGGSADLINLPALGIRGNSHTMMDKNSTDIAAVIQKWLQSRGFVH